MKNYYELDKDLKEKWTPKLKEFVDNLRTMTEEWDQNASVEEYAEAIEKCFIDFTNTGMAPTHINSMIKELSGVKWKRDQQYTNGWYIDHWSLYKADGFHGYVIEGSVDTGEIYLRAAEDYWNGGGY